MVAGNLFHPRKLSEYSIIGESGDIYHVPNIEAVDVEIAKLTRRIRLAKDPKVARVAQILRQDRDMLLDLRILLTPDPEGTSC